MWLSLVRTEFTERFITLWDSGLVCSMLTHCNVEASKELYLCFFKCCFKTPVQAVTADLSMNQLESEQLQTGKVFFIISVSSYFVFLYFSFMAFFHVYFFSFSFVCFCFSKPSLDWPLQTSCFLFLFVFLFSFSPLFLTFFFFYLLIFFPKCLWARHTKQRRSVTHSVCQTDHSCA